ncbi:MAG: class I SAM-dependent methyltransferase [Ardenticatenaceae bacterium]|nr:class I SAM-dependent methyltransferase [Ardenticatenaceae bacterium]
MADIKRTLTTDEARRFYDRFGIRQDYQSWYEGPAVDQLITHGRFGQAASTVEFGCGTGALARELLTHHLPAEARYLGVDISQTMVDLTRERIQPFGERAAVVQSDGRPHIDLPSASVDRFVSAYVLDLLSEVAIQAVLSEAQRLLRPDGLLCLVSLTHGINLWGKIVERAWVTAHRWNPERVGGCRPISLSAILPPAGWRIDFQNVISIWGMASEVVIAGKPA